jgi:hypothetical protein
MAKEEISRGWRQPNIELGPSGTAPPGPTSGYVKTGRIVNGKTEYIKKHPRFGREDFDTPEYYYQDPPEQENS